MRTAAALVSISLFYAFSAFAAAVTVGCPGGTPGTYPSIGAALAALDSQGPHTITVTGTCTETVTIDQRERLTIQAPPAQSATINGTALFGISIRDSATIVLRNLNVTGVRAAISVANLSSVSIAGVNASSTSARPSTSSAAPRRRSAGRTPPMRSCCTTRRTACASKARTSSSPAG